MIIIIILTMINDIEFFIVFIFSDFIDKRIFSNNIIIIEIVREKRVIIIIENGAVVKV
jgi:hypothetical protein